jgi:monoamine oxidase
MARTPLFRRLLTLARVADDSHRTGVPVDELLDGARSVDRRTFVAGAAALGLGAAACADVPGRVAPTAPRAPRFERANGSRASVAIVGAGLAGLTCALRLRQAGVLATVYEASDRAGGRCWTRRTENPFLAGQLAERGGELIDQSHTEIRQLAQELGLRLDNVLAAEPNGTEARFWFDDALYTPTQAARDLKAVWQPLKRDYVEASYPTLYTESTPRGRALDAMSVAEWIERTVPGGRTSRLGQLLETAYVIEYGAEAGDQSALNLVYLLGAIGQGQLRVFGPSNEKYKVRGGNDLLVSAMEAQLAGQIARNTPLTSIVAAPGGRWTLGFRGRAPVTVDRVVLALPFRILRELDIAGAGFPAVKRLAIAELGMGANTKLALQFATRRWHAHGCNGDTTSDRGYQQTWEATRAQVGEAGILVNYTGGAEARRQSGGMPAMLADRFLTGIEPVLPGLRARYLDRVTFDDWPRHPWTLGSYSYWRVGQYTAFAGAEGAAHGSCHFAGEHTSVDAQGYLEGAVESGGRAAREVLAGLGVVKKA